LIMNAFNVSAPVRHYVAGAEFAAVNSDVVFVIPELRLTGEALLAFVNEHTARMPYRSDLVAASGYIKEGGKLAFVDFYENLLAAKQAADPEYFASLQTQAQKDEDEEYDTLSEDGQKLYDEVHTMFGEKWDHDEIMGMVDDLSGIGIETAQQLTDRFYQQLDNGWKWQAEFAEEYVCELEYSLQHSLVFHAIDWEAVWQHQLQYDFDTIERDGEVFVFSQG
jgi:hypothetical protein